MYRPGDRSMSGQIQGEYRSVNVILSDHVEIKRERHAADGRRSNHNERCLPVQVHLHASSPTACDSHTQMRGFAAPSLWYDDPDSWFHGSGGIAASIEAAVLAAMNKAQPHAGGD